MKSSEVSTAHHSLPSPNTTTPIIAWQYLTRNEGRGLKTCFLKLPLRTQGVPPTMEIETIHRAVGLQNSGDVASYPCLRPKPMHSTIAHE